MANVCQVREPNFLVCPECRLRGRVRPCAHIRRILICRQQGNPNHVPVSI
jgi:hypothetical protein